LTTLPLGLMFQTMCPIMTPSVRQWCMAGWQKCQPSQLEDWANRHKLLPTLEYCLRQHQLWEQVPTDVQELMQQSRQRHGLRQLQVVSQLVEMDAALSQAGEELVLLKGAALLHYSLYPNLGSRVNADIDVLAAPDRVHSIAKIFQYLGYTFQDTYDEVHHYDHHLPPLVRPNSLPVEIHPLQPGIANHINQRMLETAEPIEGFEALKLPIVTELFWHVALHARFNVPQLRNLLDLYRLRSLYSVDELLLANRAQAEGLEPEWSILMSQLAEFERGQLCTQTIHSWEWLPSPQFDVIHVYWKTWGWSLFFQPVTIYPHGLLGKLLILPSAAWRLVRLIGLMGAYLFSLRELSLADLPKQE
jgi:hypothetical protein